MTIRAWFMVAAFGAGGGLSAFLLTQNSTIAICVVMLATSAAHAFATSLMLRRNSSDAEAAAMIAELLAAQLTAGVTFAEAVQGALFECPAALRFRLERLHAIFESDASIELKILDSKRVLGCREGDLIFELILLAARFGDDDLADSLNRTAASVRRGLALERELKARQGWVLGTARLGQTAPWIIVILLSARAETAAAFQSPAGVAVLLVGLALSFGAQRFIAIGARLPLARRAFGVPS